MDSFRPFRLAPPDHPEHLTKTAAGYYPPPPAAALVGGWALTSHQSPGPKSGEQESSYVDWKEWGPPTVV